MLYPLSYAGGDWRKGGRKGAAAATFDTGCGPAAVGRARGAAYEGARAVAVGFGTRPSPGGVPGALWSGGVFEWGTGSLVFGEGQ